MDEALDVLEAALESVGAQRFPAESPVTVGVM
jgi:hypothetical protein